MFAARTSVTYVIDGRGGRSLFRTCSTGPPCPGVLEPLTAGSCWRHESISPDRRHHSKRLGSSKGQLWCCPAGSVSRYGRSSSSGDLAGTSHRSATAPAGSPGCTRAGDSGPVVTCAGFDHQSQATEAWRALSAGAPGLRAEQPLLRLGTAWVATASACPWVAAASRLAAVWCDDCFQQFSPPTAHSLLGLIWPHAGRERTEFARSTGNPRCGSALPASRAPACALRQIVP